LPAERLDGERATPADLGRLVEWLAYLGALLYRSGASDSSARDLYQQLDAARDETGVFLTRAREGAGPPAQDYTRLRSTLARLHERLRTLGGA
jgi:ABC-type transporter Mla subunit MlaD